MREDGHMPDEDISASDLLKTLLAAIFMLIGAALYMTGTALGDVSERLLKQPSPTAKQDNAIRKALDRYGR